MHSNQRARLVLHPVVFIALLVIAGCALGLGIVWRRSSSASGASESGTTQATAIAGLQISSDHLDFGEVGLDRSVSRQLRLGNSGPDPIALRIEGGDAFVVNPRRLTVQPQTAARVTVTANPTKPGAMQAQLFLFQDGAAEPSLVVSLEANASVNATGTREPSGADPEAGSEQDADAVALSGQPGTAEVYPLGGVSPAANADGTQPAGSVQISRTMGEGAGDDSGSATASSRSGSASAAPPTVAAPFDATPRTPRSIADRPRGLPTGSAPVEGEEAVDITHKNPHDADELAQDDDSGGGSDDAQPSAFVVASSSSLSLMGTMNRFYPQQIGVSGSESGGAFGLVTGIQFPKIPLAFGQSMTFAQNGPATGQYDHSSGQTELRMILDATDSNGRTAPVDMRLTTGSVVTRNNSGVLISVNGQPRVGSSGQLRLVGIGKIPLNFGNAAEQQLVMVDIIASLAFGSSGQGQ